MFLFRICYFCLVLHIAILTMASFVAFFITNALGIQNEWGYLIVLYSVFGFGGAFVSLALSRWMAKKFMRVRVIEPETARGEEADLINMVSDMARNARLPVTPEVGIYESPSANAFATGPTKRKSLVAFSSGLLASMNKEELEGVVAHEIAHIANGDMVTMTLLQGMINTMVLLAARAVTNIIVSRMRERSFFLELTIYMGLQMAFSVLGSVVLAYYSRAREYRADKGGAKFSSVENMIAALKALQRNSEMAYATATQGKQTAEQMQYLQISGRAKRVNWFSTHPPLEDRIKSLERYYS